MYPPVDMIVAQKLDNSLPRRLRGATHGLYRDDCIAQRSKQGLKSIAQYRCRM